MPKPTDDPNVRQLALHFAPKNFLELALVDVGWIARHLLEHGHQYLGIALVREVKRCLCWHVWCIMCLNCWLALILWSGEADLSGGEPSPMKAPKSEITGAWA